MMAGVDGMKSSLIIYGVICMLIAVALVAIFTIFMLKALEQLVPVIDKTANYDFSSDKESEALEKRGDEVGLIAKALAKTRTHPFPVREAV